MPKETAWKWSEELRRDVYPVSPGEVLKPLSLLGDGQDAIGSWLLAVQNEQRIQDHLLRYFTANYSGKNFEWFIDQASSRYFSPWHILAIESLSVSIPTPTARWLLEKDEKRDELLDEINHRGLEKETLWSCDLRQLMEDGELSDLYDLLRAKNGLGYVTTSKLLAAIFPTLVPIRDSLVEELLGMSDSSDWWIPMRRLFENSPRLESHLCSFDIPSAIGEVSTLRRLDVILWMEAKARSFRPRQIKKRR